METLERYRNKRNFDRTSEPYGSSPGTLEQAPIFAVQFHLARRAHFDLRLEWEGVLLSWAVPKGPSFDPSDRRLAVRVEDHPIEYANFEGNIPKGEYGGGTVQLWDEGRWLPLDGEVGLQEGVLKFILYGSRLKGGWTLVRMEGENWLWIKERDRFAQSGPGIEGFTTGIRSGLTTEEIAQGVERKTKKNSPQKIPLKLQRQSRPEEKSGKKISVSKPEAGQPSAPSKALPGMPPLQGERLSRADGRQSLQSGGFWLPMLAMPAEGPPADDGFVYEVKYDGWRILAVCGRGNIRLITRSGRETDEFREISSALSAWTGDRDMVLDGEVAAIGPDGRTDFQLLRHRSERSGKLVYMVFDLLALNGEDLRKLPLLDRKKRLENILEDAPPVIRYSRHVEGRGEDCLRAARELRLEGIVGKRVDSAYQAGRSRNWIKWKCARRQEFVIGGFTRTSNRREDFSALMVGGYADGQFRYAGKVGTGFDEKTRRALFASFQKIIRKTSPFADPPKVGVGEQLFWLSPRLIAEIRFTERTADGLLRQASFLGIRTDKDPKAVCWQEIFSDNPTDPKLPPKEELQTEPAGKMLKKSEISSEKKLLKESAQQKTRQKPFEAGKIRVGKILLSSPDRLVFASPAVSKLEVARYYEAAAGRMLRILAGRPISAVRCHDGTQNCFFRKHPDGEGEGLTLVELGGEEPYFCLKNQTGLLREVQMGTVEFHAWACRADSPERPDLMTFDLDPDEGLPISVLREGVREVKSVLDSLGLVSFLKASGGKGFHIVLPFAPKAGWEAFSAFSAKVAEIVQKSRPDLFTLNIRKATRKGKIFLDFLRNKRGATAVAPWSLRARPGAKVALPLDWTELNEARPDGFDLFSALARLKAPDPWKDLFKVTQSLSAQRPDDQKREASSGQIAFGPESLVCKSKENLVFPRGY